MTHIHGGNIYQYKEAADFSANINFHGMPQSVKEAAHAAIDRSIHYPEPDSRSLKAVLAEREGVPESAIICGNGAAELMFALAIAKRPKKAVLAQPCFFEYEQALTAVGCTLVHVLLKKEDGFQVGMAVCRADSGRRRPCYSGQSEQSDRAVGSTSGTGAGTCCLSPDWLHAHDG